MPLASFEFLVFLFAAAPVLYLLPPKLRRPWLLASSLAYLALVSLESLLILLCLAGITYIFGLAIASDEDGKRKAAFYGGLLVLVAALLLFKFTPLYETIQSQAASWLGRDQDDVLSRALIPLGLSFFVFTALSYLLEVYHRRIEPVKNPGLLALHLLLFPKIAQGPIERPAPLLNQLHSRLLFDEAAVAAGLKRILWGFFKKMVVADRITLYVNSIYGNAARHNGTSLLLAAIFYSFQIYADFSGYTDIALGSARILGLKLSENFQRPYFARTIRDFWNRWHISFSSWLRDYLFLPLAYALSRKMRNDRTLGVKTDQVVFSISILITFFVCGLWHGMGLNFILWGLLFGVYLAVGQGTRRFRKKLRARLRLKPDKTRKPFVPILTTFGLVTAAWILFRIPDLPTIRLVFKKILTQPGIPFGYTAPPMILFPCIGILLLMAFEARDEFYRGKRSSFRNRRLSIRLLSYAFLVITILLIGVLDGGQFIYFQF